MGKHLGFKAFVLLVVMFFHSFVLVPITYAGTVVDMAAARSVLRAVAPSVVAATPAGWGYWLGIAVSAGIIYMAVKSGAVTDLKNWLTSWVTPTAENTSYLGPLINIGGTNYRYRFYWEPGNGKWAAEKRTAADGYMGGSTYYYNTWLAAYQGVYGVAYSPPTAPTIPTDYSTLMAAHNPTFSANGVFYSPGGAAQLAASGGGGTIIKAEQKSDADLDLLKGALGMTAADPSTGAQPNPTANDNTLSPGENQSIPLFQQMVNYLSNLIGIKSDTGRIADSNDNIAVGVAAQTTAITNMAGKMDNIAILSQAQKNALDNAVVAINNQTAIDNQILVKMDNVAQTLDTFKNTSASQSTLSSRIGEIKDLLLSKFPFSIVGAVTSPGSVSGGTYTIPDLHFPLGMVVSVDPMANTEIHSWFTWCRGLIAVGMWAVFILVMVRRVTEI